MSATKDRRNNDRDLLIELKTLSAVMQKDITDIKTTFQNVIQSKADKTEIYELHKVIDRKADKDTTNDLQGQAGENRKDINWLKSMIWMGMGGLAAMQVILQFLLKK